MIGKLGDTRKQYILDWQKNKYANDEEYRNKKKESAKNWGGNNPEARRIIAKNCYWRNRDKYLKLGKLKTQKLKLEILVRYSGIKPKCACCAEPQIEFLTIDHIENNGAAERKKLRKLGISFYRWLKQNNFPKGYRVLCMNCNFALGKFGYCPHRDKRKRICTK
jgi:hypothetical protein